MTDRLNVSEKAWKIYDGLTRWTRKEVIVAIACTLLGGVIIKMNFTPSDAMRIIQQSEVSTELCSHNQEIFSDDSSLEMEIYTEDPKSPGLMKYLLKIPELTLDGQNVQTLVIQSKSDKGGSTYVGNRTDNGITWDVCPILK